MFFPRLRRQAKWMFVLLALVFGLGFVVFGVGSGGGLGLGDILKGVGRGSSGSDPVKKAREQVQEHPRSAQAHLQLAEALQRSGDLKGATTEYVTYTTLRPKDTTAIAALAGLYLNRGNQIQRQAYNAQLAIQQSNPGSFLPPLTVKGQTVLQSDPLGEIASKQSQQRFNELYANAQGAFSQAVVTYKRLVKMDPQPTYQLELAQAATSAGDYPTAITVYSTFLKRYPNDPNAPVVKSQLKQLKQAVAKSSAG